MNKLEKFFSFSWFSNPQRQLLLDLQVEEQRLKNRLVEQTLETLQDTQLHKELDRVETKPYKHLMFNGVNVTVVLNDGSVLNGDCDIVKYEAIKDSKSYKEIKDLLFVPLEVKKSEEVETKEERQLITDNLAILKSNEDFEIKGNDVYLKGVSLRMPSIVVASFIEICEKSLAISSRFNVAPLQDYWDMTEIDEKYQSLKMFWLKLATNSIPKCRESILKFCKDNDVRITKTGNLIGYRRIVKWQEGVKTNKKLFRFAKSAKVIVKGWKKSCDKYVIYSSDDFKGYKMTPLDKVVTTKFQERNHIVLGTINEVLANGTKSKGDTIYTSWHNKGQYTFKIGDVYKLENGEEPDDNLGNCSSNGIHYAACSYDYSGFGDTMVVVLINPSKTIFVPSYDSGKARCSEMKIACLNPNQHGTHIDESLIEKEDEEYNEYTIEELSNIAVSKSFEELTVQENVPEINLKDVKNIVFLLKGRVKLIN